MSPRTVVIGTVDLGARRHLEQCVNKRRHGGALGEDDESAEQNHNNDDGREPKFLAFAHEIPHVLHKFNHRNRVSVSASLVPLRVACCERHGHFSIDELPAAGSLQ